MSGDYETLDINQPKISYYQEKSDYKNEYLAELINTIDEMKKKLSEFIEK